jgi:UDP-glucose 4-epimerase
MYVVWFGFYPLNERLLARKLQIKVNVPVADIQRGFGSQHMLERRQLLAVNEDKVKNGLPLQEVSGPLHYLIATLTREKKTYLVTGGCGFIGSHMVDKLIAEGHTVYVVDNLLSGNVDNLNQGAKLINADICNFEEISNAIQGRNVDGIFHFAAIARTPWCIDDPLLCYKTNVMGTLNLLEAARQNRVKRVVLSSSNVVYAFLTPYRTSKEAVESLGDTYHAMYGLSVVSLRYSNVYGKRQSELGPSPNVFAALRKSKKELGKLIITGDGEQTRNYTHVSDIVHGNLCAMNSDYCGTIDLCTGVPVSLNSVAKYFECPVEYIEDRPGDVKHIVQSPDKAFQVLGWKAVVPLEVGILDVLKIR